MKVKRSEPIDGVVGVMPPPVYSCSNGHDIFLSGPGSIERCPRAGCDGTLRRVGPGSRKEQRRA